MKQILAIAIGILMMGSDASEAELIDREDSKNVLRAGRIIGQFPPDQSDSADLDAWYHVYFANRLYKCGVLMHNQAPLILCWDDKPSS